MGYFNAISNAWFKKDENSKTVFYPHGKLGSGYILDQVSEKKIRSFVKWYNIVVFPIVVVTTMFFRWYALLLLIIFWPTYEIAVRRLLKGQAKTQTKMSIREVNKNMARSFGLPWLILLLLMSLLMFMASLVVLIFTDRRTIGVVGVLLFGLGIFQSVWQIKMHFNNAR